MVGARWGGGREGWWELGGEGGGRGYDYVMVGGREGV